MTKSELLQMKILQEEQQQRLKQSLKWTKLLYHLFCATFHFPRSVSYFPKVG